MGARRRIDWPELIGSEPERPIWKAARARSETVALVRALAPLWSARHPDDLAKRAVELALSVVGLVRAGIYFYDDRLDLMVGAWGTDLRRRVIDEHHAMFRLDEHGREVFERAMSGQSLWTVVEDCPIIVNEATSTRVVGRGWVVCTPVCSATRPLGALYSDAGLTRASVDPRKQENAALLCALTGMLLGEMPRSRSRSFVSGLAAPHPAVTKAARLLSSDPSQSGAELATHLRVTPGRFARVFKTEMGVSLVRYRNQLRLERFLKIMEDGRTNMRDAARAAGFGSYAQFHRVFQALRGRTPRAFLGRRGEANPPGPRSGQRRESSRKPRKKSAGIR
jgi:methylphosphotriester-DNA--protein-cysteine methyltransferase